MAIIVSGNTSDDVERAMQADLDTLSNWFMANKLIINPSKTKALLFRYHQKPHSILNLSVGGVCIEQVDKFKYLGILLDETVTFKPHINSICSALGLRTHLLNRLKKCLPKTVNRNCIKRTSALR
jgi:hypothetical protein